MNNLKHLIYALFSVFIILVSFFYVEKKLINYGNSESLDIEKIANIQPLNWYPVESVVTNPAWKNSANVEYDRVAAKSYENDKGEKVTLVLTWSRNGLQRAGHIQQLCYATQGFNVENVHDINIKINGVEHKMTAFSAKKVSGNIEDVLYWRLTDGELLTNSSDIQFNNYRLQHRLFRMRELLLRIFKDIPDNVMVRVSTTRTEKEDEKNTHIKFIKDYLENLPDEYRKKIIAN